MIIISLRFSGGSTGEEHDIAHIASSIVARASGLFFAVILARAATSITRWGTLMGTVQNHLEGQMYIRPHSTGTDVNQPLDKPSQDDLQAVDALCLRHALMNQRDP